MQDLGSTNAAAAPHNLVTGIRAQLAPQPGLQLIDGHPQWPIFRVHASGGIRRLQ